MPIPATRHRSDIRLISHRQKLNRLVLILWFGLNGISLNLSTAETINAGGQRARDDERISILKTELNRTDQSLQLLSRRHTERVDASDVKGAAEIESEKRRVEQDKAALIRELDSASRAAGGSTSESTLAGQARAPQPRKAPAPWWDIYGKSSSNPVSLTSIETPTSVSHPTPTTSLK